MDNRLVYSPVGMLLMLFLAFLLFMVVGFLFLDLARTAFTKIGFTWGQALFVLLASLLCSSINIPITDMQCSVPMVRERNVRAFGVPYRIPVVESRSCDTLLAINVGGAVIPSLISIVLVLRFPASLSYALAGIAFVAILTNRVAKPVAGFGNRHTCPSSSLECGSGGNFDGLCMGGTAWTYLPHRLRGRNSGNAFGSRYPEFRQDPQSGGARGQHRRSRDLRRSLLERPDRRAPRMNEKK